MPPADPHPLDRIQAAVDRAYERGNSWPVIPAAAELLLIMERIERLEERIEYLEEKASNEP